LEQDTDFGAVDIELDGARKLRLQTDDRAQQARFAGAGRPNQTDELSLPDFQARPFKDGLGAI
jgi:hypothetical protein